MNLFHFTSPLLHTVEKSDETNLPYITIEQNTSLSIGFKLYPGALILAKYLEKLWNDSSDNLTSYQYVLELGAGIAPIPSLLLSAIGAKHVIATDIPDVYPLLKTNLLQATVKNHIPCVTAKSLFWGTDTTNLFLDEYLKETSSDNLNVSSASGNDNYSFDLILGADIVYHEHLIDPLLETLVSLTNQPKTTPQKIILSYVQRFKRAKLFFKRATRWFHVEKISMGQIIDYQELSWQLPSLLKRSGIGISSDHPPIFSSKYVEYDHYIALLRKIALVEEAQGLLEKGNTVISSDIIEKEEKTISSPLSSDTSEEDENQAWRAMTRGSTPAIHTPNELHNEVNELCHKLGIPCVRPTDAYIYIFTRK